MQNQEQVKQENMKHTFMIMDEKLGNAFLS